MQQFKLVDRIVNKTVINANTEAPITLTIPRDSVLTIFETVRNRAGKIILYKCYWWDNNKKYIVSIKEGEMNSIIVQPILGGSPKRRKSRKTRSKSKRRHTRKN